MSKNHVRIDLSTGKTGKGDLELILSVGNTDQLPWDWRFTLSVLGGGLIERKGKFDFEAPLDGYQSTLEVGMSANEAGWTAALTKEYFAKLADGSYARFSIRFYAGRRPFVVI